MAYPAPAPFLDAIRGSLSLTYMVSATYGGVPVVGAEDLRPTGGSITDTTKPGVRRLLNVEFAGGQDLFDLLSPIGTRLSVTCRVRYSDQSTVDIPMGVFDVDSENISEGGGSVSLTAPDKWVVIQRAGFVVPTESTPGLRVTSQITELIRGALGPDEPVQVTATSTANVGALTWEKDRDKAIIDLATNIGAWVFFDRDGVATIADIPTIGDDPDWLIDAGPTGVLIELDRERSRQNTRNVVVVESSASDGEKFPTQVVWDIDSNSPTYAGTDPTSPSNVPGPFGVVPYYFDTPILEDEAAARAAGYTILARVTGLASQVSLGGVPNPAIDAFDVLDVGPPTGWSYVVEYAGGEGFGTMPFGTGPFGGGTGTETVVRVPADVVLERHVADTVTHPLTLGSAQQIDGRSTRTDELT